MPAPSRIALITGGSRGLGRSTVEALARRGVSSIFTYNSNRDAADEVVAAVELAGARAAALQLDTGSSAAFPDFVVDPRARAVEYDWESVARHVVGAFRVDAARAGAAAEVGPLVDELCRLSPEFRAMWHDNDVLGAHGEPSSTYATRFSARSPLNTRPFRSTAEQISAWWSSIRRRRWMRIRSLRRSARRQGARRYDHCEIERDSVSLSNSLRRRAIEGFNKSVLLWLARGDIMPADIVSQSAAHRCRQHSAVQTGDLAGVK